MELSDSIREVAGIGPRYQQLLETMGIETVEDLVMHIPFRYEDYSKITTITSLVANIPATVTGTITKIDVIYTRFGKKLTKAVLEDETGKLQLLWFNQPYLKTAIPVGTTVSVSGKLDEKSPKPQFTSPKWEKIDLNVDSATHTGRLVPIYSLTEGLTDKWIRQKIADLLEVIRVAENLPQDLLEQFALEERDTAIRHIHFPDDEQSAHAGRYRLSFEELFFLHLQGIHLRSKWTQKKNGHKLTLDTKTREKFMNALPYALTNAQKHCIGEILGDLESDIPMNRLLQGDVGSGKTVVAAIGLLACALKGFTALYMAPTQILAEQHLKTITTLLAPFGIEVELVTGGTKSKKEKNAKIKSKEQTHSGDLGKVVIGTHALLHRISDFQHVGLVVIDEQHKFGVSQRTQLVEYFSTLLEEAEEETLLLPNLLTMTATPIPRTYALALYGDLEVSVIDEIPIGRKVVTTWVVDEPKRERAYEWIKGEMTKNHTQVFLVCPFIEQSQTESLQNVKAAEKEFENLQETFKEFRLILLHGRMKGEEKEEVMQKFKNHEYDMLVATPVIEVGIDISNANIIVIETPERFGLASLHQLRGRVGRGKDQGYCLLMASPEAAQARHRLTYLEKIHKGNELAEIDLRLRGPGNFYGTEQSGILNLKVADITDFVLVKQTKTCAQEYYNNRKKYAEIQQFLAKVDTIGNN